MKRKIEITIETERVVVAGTRRDGGEKWCDECGAEARLIALEDAAALLRVPTDTVLRWASEARLHVIETGGSVSICLTSLSQGRTPSAAIEMRETDGGAFHA